MAQQSVRRVSGRAVVLTAVAVLIGLIGVAMLVFTMATRPIQRPRDPVEEALAVAARQWSERVHPTQSVNHVALLTRFETCATARVDYGADTPGREVRLQRDGGSWRVDDPQAERLGRDTVPDEAACRALS
ncbi:MAG: hypothetical protein IPI32_12725 [Austwickia sp.]|jgi:hypothetical protein|nr:hypothetical protein [Austwickia sp.]MBK8435099.1 hypothetical protein [Austwickia sp.]MBK9101348.1 hypothetical protein [Austwickia sp.]